MLKLSEKNKQKFKKYILKNSFEVYNKILNEFNSKGKSRIWNEFSAFANLPKHLTEYTSSRYRRGFENK